VALTVLDAGVVIAFFDANDPHYDAARDALTAATDAQDDLVLPASAYSEVLVRPFMRGDTAVDRIDGLIDELPARVEAASRSIAKAAAALRAEHGRTLRLPDALVLATAADLGADRVLTTDRGLYTPGLVVDVIGGA